MYVHKQIRPLCNYDSDEKMLNAWIRRRPDLVKKYNRLSRSQKAALDCEMELLVEAWPEYASLEGRRGPKQPLLQGLYKQLLGFFRFNQSEHPTRKTQNPEDFFGYSKGKLWYEEDFDTALEEIKQQP